VRCLTLPEERRQALGVVRVVCGLRDVDGTERRTMNPTLPKGRRSKAAGLASPSVE
jgi:hypothetical protein